MFVQIFDEMIILGLNQTLIDTQGRGKSVLLAQKVNCATILWFLSNRRALICGRICHSAELGQHLLLSEKIYMYTDFLFNSAVSCS